MRSKENDRRIRNRLIRSLGIIEETSASSMDTLKKPQHHNRNILSEATIEEPLKNHCNSRRRKSNHTKKQGTTEESKEQMVMDEQPPHSKIQFNSVVQIKTIPSHCDYSDRVKKHLWSNRHELRESTERNMREFAFEGWSVHHVIEEDDMYFDKLSLEYVHPVHVAGVGFQYYY
ncbi:hypothetical protein IV203_028753 [Nitzschia inconspicua]|uniref:Uncharacterized protein n=1 Tax=Nitzschia inconspicua TaxID=303405 RepID=A0A9K3LPH2_9STRA|nr:hypothetical protein IV203_028753 [Nitzschia inconspicua]